MPIDLTPRNAVVRAIARGPAGPASDPPIPVFEGTSLHFLMPDSSTTTPVNLIGPEGPSGNARSFDTVAQATAAHIASGTTFIFCAGRTAISDEPGGLWFKPVSFGFASDDMFQSADGQWWARALRGPIQAFIIEANSNAVGNAHPEGGPYTSPNPEVGTVFKWRSGSIQHGADPVGGVDFGSMWPAFAMSVYSMTRVPVLLISTAIGATSLTATADGGAGNWSDTGTLLAAAFATADDALDAIEDYGFVVVSKTVCWRGGEIDAEYWDSVPAGPSQATTRANLITEVKTQLIGLISDNRTHFGANTQFWMWELGVPNGADTPGWAAVRDALNHEITSGPGLEPSRTRVVSRVQKLFYQLGLVGNVLYQEVGEVHDSQPGANLAGRVGAVGGITGRDSAVVTIEGAYPDIPYYALPDALTIFGFGANGASLKLQAIGGHGFFLRAMAEGDADQRKFCVVDAGGTVLLKLDQLGILELIKTLMFAASTTSRASLNIPAGTAPTSPSNGDIWSDGTNLKMRIDGVTKTFTLT